MRTTTKTIVAFDEGQLEDIKEIRKALSEDSLGQISNEEVFLIALGLGFASRLPVEVFKRSNTGVRFDYIKRSPEVLMLLTSIHLEITGDLDSIVELDEILNTAERFAATGFKFLKEALSTEPDLRMWLHLQVQKAYEDAVKSD